MSDSNEIKTQIEIASKAVEAVEKILNQPVVDEVALNSAIGDLKGAVSKLNLFNDESQIGSSRLWELRREIWCLIDRLIRSLIHGLERHKSHDHDQDLGR